MQCRYLINNIAIENYLKLKELKLHKIPREEVLASPQQQKKRKYYRDFDLLKF